MDTTRCKEKEQNPQLFSSLFMEAAKIGRYYLQADGSVSTTRVPFLVL